MDILSLQFLSALAAIVVIDLVLAGDNAIVIALAARTLPSDLRKRAIVWGTVGAIFVRTLMTVTVVWVLKIPGLLGLGGALLIWIAYKLLIENEGDGAHKMEPASNFWAAMRTIVVADALMGLDNVLGVAGAAHGNFLLVVLGLLISIPIMIWGSQIILKFVERYPVIVYFGAGVLAWTAVKMVMSEPLVAPYLPHSSIAIVLIYMAVIAGTLGAGFLVNHREVRDRIAPYLVSVSTTPAVAPRAATLPKGADEMKKILLPVTASPQCLQAVRHVINRFMTEHDVEVHLLHVRQPFSQHIARFASRGDRAAYHREQAEKALAPARALLAQHNIPHRDHVELGDRAATIVRLASELGISEIVIGTARKNSLTRILEDSVTYEVLESSSVPVEVVAGPAVPALERWGVPAGVGALIALFLLAED